MGSSFAQGQMENVIYNFVGDFGLRHDGAQPYGELLAGTNGEYYGTTAGGGDGGCTAGGGWYLGCGTVFKLSRMPYGWVANTLLIFHGPNGAVPTGNLVIDAQGNLYGTTVEGGNPICDYGCGTVYELSPPSAPGGAWTQTMLYEFQGGFGQGGTDGWLPRAGLYMDGSGNLFGTTYAGGPNGCEGSGCGLVFELTPTGNGSWLERTIYSFQGGNDGCGPYGRLTGRGSVLYGTTSAYFCPGKSTVYSLINAGSWKKTTLHIFAGGANDGDESEAGLYLDPSGNLFGTTIIGGTFNSGTVFELSPTGVFWRETILHSFGASGDGMIPVASLTPGPNGVLYGTTLAGGGQNAIGTVFTLTSSGGQWAETVLHSFGPQPDGEEPWSGVTLGPGGSILGTAASGGRYNCYSSPCGAVYEIQ